MRHTNAEILVPVCVDLTSHRDGLLGFGPGWPSFQCVCKDLQGRRPAIQIPRHCGPFRSEYSESVYRDSVRYTMIALSLLTTAAIEYYPRVQSHPNYRSGLVGSLGPRVESNLKQHQDISSDDVSVDNYSIYVVTCFLAPAALLPRPCSTLAAFSSLSMTMPWDESKNAIPGSSIDVTLTQLLHTTESARARYGDYLPTRI